MDTPVESTVGDAEMSPERSGHKVEPAKGIAPRKPLAGLLRANDFSPVHILPDQSCKLLARVTTDLLR